MGILRENLIIQVHFDSLDNPTRVTYAAYIDDYFVVLADEDATDENIEDIKTSEIKMSNEESVYPYFYEVSNSDPKMVTPFVDEDLNDYWKEKLRSKLN